MIYKNASVTIKGHILEQGVEIIQKKYLKFSVSAEGSTVNLIIGKNEEKADLIRSIIKHAKKENVEKAWEFNCVLNVVESDAKYINYSLFVEDGKQIDEKIEIKSTGLDLEKMLAE